MTSGPRQPPPSAGYEQRCPRCGFGVAEGAAYCGNCGADLRPKRGLGAWWVALAVVIALLLGGGIAIALKGANNKPTTTVQKTVKTTSTIGVSVTTPTQTKTETTPATTVTATTTTTETTTAPGTST